MKQVIRASCSDDTLIINETAEMKARFERGDGFQWSDIGALIREVERLQAENVKLEKQLYDIEHPL